jgi:hypothetical protein
MCRGGNMVEGGFPVARWHVGRVGLLAPAVARGGSPGRAGLGLATYQSVTAGARIARLRHLSRSPQVHSPVDTICGKWDTGSACHFFAGWSADCPHNSRRDSVRCALPGDSIWDAAEADAGRRHDKPVLDR